MKPTNQLFSALALIVFVAAGAGCSKSDDEKAPAAAEKSDAPKKAGVMIDAATQARLGLEIATPVATNWQPEIKGFGRVLVPATLAAAWADLESARAIAEVASQEYGRQKMLAAQNNASVRTLETAKADATRAELASAVALAKFKLDWGAVLVAGNESASTASNIINGAASLVRIDLPAGESLPAPPASARIAALGNETNLVRGIFLEALAGVNPQTQSRSFLFLTTPAMLPAGAAVIGFLKTSGHPINGIVIPASAILRHEGSGWVYVQTEPDQFVRTEIPLDRPADDGWFVSENLSTTNRLVVVGAQIILSAELSGGGFNTGERD